MTLHNSLPSLVATRLQILSGLGSSGIPFHRHYSYLPYSYIGTLQKPRSTQLHLQHQYNHSLNLLQLHTKRFLAGHNKWSKIKHKKGAKDVNRATQFSKATRAIRAASKACGGDMANLHLQSSVQAAKAIQVPKDRIEDAIKSATAKASDENLVNMRYDGRLKTPGGKVAVILTALTDNKNRTAANVRSKIKKSDGELLSTGTNDWLFDHVGVALVHKDKGTGDNDDGSEADSTLFTRITEEEEEAMLEHALDAGASDIDFGDDKDEHALVKCEPNELHHLVLAMREAGYSVSEFTTRYDANSSIDLDRESSDLFSVFLEKMEDDEDVDKVFFNAVLCEDEDSD